MNDRGGSVKGVRGDCAAGVSPRVNLCLRGELDKAREAGIGLAAPQVGVGERLIIALRMKDVDDVNAEPVALVNPKVLTASSELWSYDEGCLSIPGVTGPVLRAVSIEVEYQDLGLALDLDLHRSQDSAAASPLSVTAMRAPFPESRLSS